MAKREADRKGEEKDDTRVLFDMLPSEATKVEEEYDWDEIRPLPLDGQGKVVCVTDDKGSSERQHPRRRGKGRARRLRKAREEKRKGGELRMSTSRGIATEETRKEAGGAPYQDAELLLARNVLSDPGISKGAKGYPVMAARQGISTLAEGETPKVGDMARNQEQGALPARCDLFDPKEDPGSKGDPPLAARQGSGTNNVLGDSEGPGMAPRQVNEFVLPNTKAAWKNLKDTVLREDDQATAATEPMSDDEFDDEEEENWAWMQRICTGLDPPSLWSGERINGANKRQHRRENKATRIERQEAQPSSSYWASHKGEFTIPPPAGKNLDSWKGDMCPQNLALHHPAAAKLLEYATGGCPCNTGKPWSKDQIWAAVERGPHVSALEEDAIAQLEGEIAEKVKARQCRVVLWDDIKDNPPEQLKISPLAMIPHKSRKYRAILDLSFRIRLKNGHEVPSVNEGTTLEAPAGAIDQLGHSLQRIIHAFAEVDDDAKIFMAKFDIKDGFWRLQCAEGEEWNFAYVLPQKKGEPVRLVVPWSLQMGWVESPPYFCAASETGRDVAAQYAETPVGNLQDHKFVHYAMGNEDVTALPEKATGDVLKYFLDVYVDDYLAMAVATSQEQLRHVANAVMKGVHDVFPPDEDDSNDPLSLKKLEKKEGEWALLKDMLGFDFNGDLKTMQLEEKKRTFLLGVLQKWLRTEKSKTAGIELSEFESVIAKIRHGFMCIPAGRGLLSPCNKILAKRPPRVYLHRNKRLSTALRDIRTILREATKRPTKCKELVMGPPDCVGTKDASIHGVGGCIVGEGKASVPTVFRHEWPDWVKKEVRRTNQNQKGTLTNSDLEMAGLLMLWLVMEEVCNLGSGSHVALFSDNSPTVSWVNRLASRNSQVADQLIRALALRLKVRQVSPLCTLHIAGEKNEMTDMPSRSFGSEPKWHCKTDDEFLAMYNSLFPLPNPQDSWTVFQLSPKIISMIYSALRTGVLGMEEWRRLPKPGRLIGGVTFEEKCNAALSFAAAIRVGRYGGGRQVRAGTVSAALAAVNTTIALAIDQQPLKVQGSKDFIPVIAQTLAGWRKEDPPVQKKMPVEADVPEYLAEAGRLPEANELGRAVGDLSMMAFYFLLRVGEYTVKGTRDEAKQTVQFRIKDVTFFKKNDKGVLRQLPRDSEEEVLLTADAVTLKLENQKNGWKGVCVSHHSNGQEFHDPVKAVARRYCHIRRHTKVDTTFLSAYFEEGERFDVRDSDIRAGLKVAALALDYEGTRGIPVDKVDTHSLRIGGANALSLNGYSKEQIQKMGTLETTAL
eukprot:scaffold53123_cov73-Cyclotella_meneghiniana.AAC.1